MTRWFNALFAWRTVRKAGCHAYQQNAITGDRRVRRINRYGYSPIDWRWLQTGEWSKPPATLPRER